MFENLIKLAKNKEISDLNFYNFKLTVKQFCDIIELFKFENNIETINLGSNNLTDNEIVNFCEIIKNNKNNLKEINLSGNIIGKKGAYSISNMIKNNSKIQNIDLSWNKIKDMGAISIMHSIESAPNLKFVNIDWNGVKNKRKIKNIIEQILKKHKN